MWMFHDFSVTQISREINFGDSKVSKFTISTHLEAQILIFVKFCTFGKLKFTKLTKFRARKKAKNGSFTTSKLCKIVYTENLSDFHTH